MRISVIMPVYNERATVVSVIERVRALPIEKEIIIVDDGSTDGTREILAAIQNPEPKIQNRKGSARSRETYPIFSSGLTFPWTTASPLAPAAHVTPLAMTFRTVLS